MRRWGEARPCALPPQLRGLMPKGGSAPLDPLRLPLRALEPSPSCARRRGGRVLRTKEGRTEASRDRVPAHRGGLLSGSEGFPREFRASRYVWKHALLPERSKKKCMHTFSSRRGRDGIATTYASYTWFLFGTRFVCQKREKNGSKVADGTRTLTEKSTAAGLKTQERWPREA